MLLQPEKQDFIRVMTKEVEAHEAINHWTLIKKSKVNNKHKNKYGNLKTILSIWNFKRKRLPGGRSTKQKSRICSQGGMKQWVVNHWETYDPVVKWIIVRSLLGIEIIHELITRSVKFVPDFTQADLDMDVFMELTLGIGVDRNRG